MFFILTQCIYKYLQGRQSLQGSYLQFAQVISNVQHHNMFHCTVQQQLDYGGEAMGFGTCEKKQGQRRYLLIIHTIYNYICAEIVAISTVPFRCEV